MPITIGYVISSEVNQDNSAETTLITPDCVQIRIWTDSVQQPGHYYVGQAGRHGRHTRYPLTVSDQQLLNKLHVAFTNAVSPVREQTKQLEALQRSYQGRLQQCKNEQDAAGWRVFGSAVGGTFLTVTGLFSLNPLFAVSGLMALSNTPSASASIDRAVQQQKELQAAITAADLKLASLKQEMKAAQQRYQAAFTDAAQRAKLNSCYYFA